MSSLVKNRREENLPYYVRFSYGVGHLLNDLCASMWFTYLLVFFHMVVKFSNEMAGYLMLIGQVADAISTPFVGLEADRWRRGLWGYGKRKSWHLIGTICVACSFPFIFNKCLGCIQICDITVPSGLPNCWAQFIYYVPFVVIFQFGWASVQISHLSLIPVLTSSDGKRVELTSIRNAFTVIAGITVYGIAWALLNANPTSTSAACTTCPNNSTIAQITPDDAPVFRTLVMTVVGIGLAFQIIFHCGTPEKNTTESVINEQEEDDIIDNECPKKMPISNNTELSSQVMSWKDWLKERQFYQLGLLYMCTRLVVNLSQVYMAMYLTVALHLPKRYIAIIPLVVFVSGFVISLFLRLINAVFGRKVTYLLGAILVISSCVWMWFICAHKTPRQIFGAAILLGFGTSTILVNSLSMTADLIGYQTNSGAFVYGAMSFTDKISNGVAVVAIQYFHPCQSVLGCPEISEIFYRKTMVFVPGSISLVALIILLTLCKTKIGKLKKFQEYPGYYESEYESVLTEERKENLDLLKNCFSCCSYSETAPLLCFDNGIIQQSDHSDRESLEGEAYDSGATFNTF